MSDTSIYAPLGASNHSGRERVPGDYYATSPEAVDRLAAAIPLPAVIWEPACREGHLSRRLAELGHTVYSSDLIDRGFGETRDFFQADGCPPDCSCILTNPPYSKGAEFVLHALDILPAYGTCFMFLKTTFLEGKTRYESLFRNNPPLCVYQFISRVTCAPGGDFSAIKSSAVSYAWFLWEKGFRGPTILRWI